jgi:CheY-like chemotaxis protein
MTGTAAKTGPAVRPRLARADGTALRALVVDDEPDLADVLSSVLRIEGWDVVTAGDGATAVRLGREFGPDAVVLDVMLPDADGLQVLRRLREDSPTVCVLFLTARDSVEDRVAGITAGGDDYVTKPFSLEGCWPDCGGWSAGPDWPTRAAPRSWWSATCRWTRTRTRCTAPASRSSSPPPSSTCCGT